MEISDKMLRNQCCGARFRFEYEDLRRLRPNISIRPIGTHGILIMYVKDGKLYYSVSFDCGKTFSEPQVIFEINGTVLTMQINDKEREVVVGLLILDDKTRQTFKKAATGEITDDGTLDLRECTQPVITDNPISVTVGFRPWLNEETNQLDGYESVDYVSQIVNTDDNDNDNDNDNDKDKDKDKDRGPLIRLDCHGHM